MITEKPKGYFKHALVVDCETSGIAFGSDDPSYDSKQDLSYQSVAWGLIVVESETLKTVEEQYIEIKWDRISLWQPQAEAIHKLTRSHLDENGLTEKEAVEEMGGLILKYWGPDNTIHAIGHNFGTFDVFFLRRMFRKFEIELKIGYRYCDTNSIGFGTFGTYTSNELFETLGMPPRKAHNALEDARMALEVVRQTRMLWKQFVLGE